MKNRQTLKRIVDTLRLIKSNGWATVAEMAAWCGKDDSAVYEWLKGTAGPSFESIWLIVHHCGDERIQLALIQTLAAGTSLRVVPADQQAADPTIAGIKSALLDVFTEVSDLATKTQKAAADGGIDHSELPQLRHERDQVVSAADKVVRDAEAAAEASERKKLTPLKFGA